MADFVIKVEGVPVPVRGVKNEKEAQAAVAEAVQNTPGFVEAQRQRYLDTGGSAANRVLIGAGRSLSSAANFVDRFANLGQERAAAAKQREASEAEAFERLDSSTEGIAGEDIGQAIGNPLNVLGAVGGVGLAGRLATAVATKVVGLAGRRAEAFANLFSRNKNLSVKEALELLQTQQGKRTAQELAAVAEKRPDVAEQALDAIVKGQRQAQVRHAAARKEAAERAAIQAREAARQKAKAEASAQAEAQRQARQQARNNFERVEVQSVKKTEQDAFREALRRANTGQ